MKKKIQKYLSGEREGFSLVELIIVIAIMAILIGVVALAVIPYLEQSRVGKDQQTVDTVYGAFQSAIADQQVTDDLLVTIKSDGTGAVDATKNGKPKAGADIITFMAKALNATNGSDIGKGTAGKLESADAKGKDIVCTYEKDTGMILVYVNDATAAKSIHSSNKADSEITSKLPTGGV